MVNAEGLVPVKEGLFTWTVNSDSPKLIGSRCSECQEVVFPANNFCQNCANNTMKEILLSRRGKLVSFTIQRFQPPPPYKFSGEFKPYGVGMIELPEGVIVTSILTESNPDKLKIGMDMELLLDKFYENEEGKQVVSYKFRPVQKDVG